MFRLYIEGHTNIGKSHKYSKPIASLKEKKTVIPINTEYILIIYNTHL